MSSYSLTCHVTQLDIPTSHRVTWARAESSLRLKWHWNFTADGKNVFVMAVCNSSVASSKVGPRRATPGSKAPWLRSPSIMAFNIDLQNVEKDSTPCDWCLRHHIFVLIALWQKSINDVTTSLLCCAMSGSLINMTLLEGGHGKYWLPLGVLISFQDLIWKESRKTWLFQSMACGLPGSRNDGASEEWYGMTLPLDSCKRCIVYWQLLWWPLSPVDIENLSATVCAINVLASVSRRVGCVCYLHSICLFLRRCSKDNARGCWVEQYLWLRSIVPCHINPFDLCVGAATPPLIVCHIYRVRACWCRPQSIPSALIREAHTWCPHFVPQVHSPYICAWNLI